MKKGMVRVLALALVLIVAGLATVYARGAREQRRDQLVFANTPKSIGIAWWDRMNEGLQIWARATGNIVYQSGSGAGDIAVQLSSIEDAIAAGVDAILVIPLSPDACEPVLGRARAAGITVISHEAEGMANVDFNIEAFINEDYGAAMMSVLAAEMGETGGFVIMVGSHTMVSHNQWADGALRRQRERYPNMYEIIPRVETAAVGGGIGQDGAFLTAREVIASHPNIRGFLGMDAVNPPGIAIAVEEAGRAGSIAITGTTLVSMSREFLERGTINTIMFWDPAAAGRAMCVLAYRVINGLPIYDGINLGVPGYERVTLRDGNQLFGNAWVLATRENMHLYNF